MRVVSLSNKMVFYVGYLSLPQPSQIFMVGSISWVINADEVGELIEPVQTNTAPTTPNTCDYRSDLGTASEVIFIDNSPPAPLLPEEANQQR